MKLAGPLHGVLVAHGAGRAQRGLLVTGPSGSGKSALALALLGRGFQLVADDRVVIWRSGARLFGRAPEALQGLLEVRGVGILRRPSLLLGPVDLLVEAALADETIERVPAPAAAEILGVSLRRLRLRLQANGACDTVAAALLSPPV